MKSRGCLGISTATECARLRAVRSEIAQLGLDAFIIGSADAHQSEYVAHIDERRRYITKFKGSAGTALVTLESALLWTDGIC